MFRDLKSAATFADMMASSGMPSCAFAPTTVHGKSFLRSHGFSATSRRRHNAFAARASLQAKTNAASLKPVSVSLKSLGCPKNVTDAEVMLGNLKSQGINIVHSAQESDVILVNTCGFIDDAKRESISAIVEATDLKAGTSKTKGVIVTGCLAQRYAEELATELPEVDAVVGFEHYDDLAERVRAVAGSNGAGAQSVQVGSPTVPFRPESDRFRLTPVHTAYVRLAEGCDHACTFCSIPSFRGKFRSKGWDAVLAETRALADAGVRELVLIAEDTNQYGMEWGRRDHRRLSHLLDAIAEDDRVRWVRLLYCYPSYFTDELIDRIANLNQVCKYIDMPLQHISDSVLRRMNRPSRAHTERLLGRLRERIPGLSVRTTFIVGFPGETDADHRELVEFVRRERFHRAGFFSYSSEDGTPAVELDGQVPDEVVELRRDELIAVQQTIQEEIALEKVGSVQQAIVDRVEDGHSIGRCRFDAPEIDGCVHVLQQLEPGTIVDVKILGTSSFDLYAEPLGAPDVA